MKIRPRIFSIIQGRVDPECFNLCRAYCFLLIEDPLALALCVLGCYYSCQVSP